MKKDKNKKIDSGKMPKNKRAVIGSGFSDKFLKNIKISREAPSFDSDISKALLELPEPLKIDMSHLEEKEKREAEAAKLTKLQLEILERELYKEKFPNPKFNHINNVLVFRDKKIPIPVNTDQWHLCRVIFQDVKSMRRVWDCDEMMEAWGIEKYEKQDLKRVYRAGREVNKKVAIQTTIDDLLDVTTKTIAVNPKYIKT